MSQLIGRRPGALLAFSAAALLFALSDLGPPSDPAPAGGARGVLYVGDVAGLAVAAFDGDTGEPTGLRAPVRGGPAQIVPVSGGGILVASLTSPLPGGSHVTHVLASGAAAAIPLEPTARDVLLSHALWQSAPSRLRSRGHRLVQRRRVRRGQ